MKLFAAIMILLFISGCSSKQAHPVNIYTLKYDASSTIPAIMITDKTLKIATPRSTKEIKKDTILYAKTPLRRDSYAFSRWSDTPNHMLAAFLVSKLDQSGIFKAVVPASSPVKSPWLLQSTVEDFYQQFDEQTSYAIIKMRFFLIDTKAKKVLARHYVSLKIPADSLDAEGGVKAFDIAMNQLGDNVKTWLLSLL